MLKPTQELREALSEVVRSTGIELPEFNPREEQRAAYLAYLAKDSLREEQVAPMLPADRIPVEAHADLMQLVLSNLGEGGDPDALRAGVLMMRTIVEEHNVNHLANSLSVNLARDLARVGTAVPEHFMGVYPTDWFYAHCIIYRGTPLLLLASGAFEMAEVAATLLLASQRDRDYAVEALYKVVREYAVSSKVAKPSSLDRGLVHWGAVCRLVTAAEEFLVAHELGHLVLGHLTDVPKKPAEGPTTTPFGEFQADLWATTKLLRRTEAAGDDYATAIACSGPLIILATSHLGASIRAAEFGATDANGYPPASERLYMVQCLMEVLGVHRSTAVGHAFVELVESAGRRYVPGFEMPPYLSRELNQKLAPVLDSLGINYEDKEFISDFM